MPMTYDDKEEDDIVERDRRYITELDVEIIQRNPVKQDLKPYIYNHIYSSGKSDRWQCENCSEWGDKWYMMKHYCKKYYQFHYNSKTTEKLNKKKLTEQKFRTENQSLDDLT